MKKLMLFVSSLVLMSFYVLKLYNSYIVKDKSLRLKNKALNSLKIKDV